MPRNSKNKTFHHETKTGRPGHKRSPQTKLMCQSAILHEFGISRADLDKYFPEPILRTNPHYHSGAKERLWERNTVLRIMKKPNLKAKYEAHLKKQELEKQRSAELAEYLMQFTPESLYRAARQMERKFVLHVGPTNSGKTYHALQALRKAHTGVYLGPLRLLALEMFDTLNDDSIPCNLLTGEEREDVPGAAITASTIELCDYLASYDVAVIDEAQLICDPARGCRWMQAICLVNAKEVQICLAPEAEALICDILNEIGAPYEVIHHERLVPLQYSGTVKQSSKILPGDAVIAFSRKRVLGIAAALEKEGQSCSVIYGALPPAARREQVRRFASGETSVVVATDAIGMGISLPIRRVIFSEEAKYDGAVHRILSPSEIKQIAGRAGRYGKYDLGEVLSMSESGVIPRGLHAPFKDLRLLRVPFPKTALNSSYTVGELLLQWQALEDVESYAREDVSEPLLLLGRLGRMANSADKKLLYELISCPVDTKSDELVRYWEQCAVSILKQETVPHPYFGGNSLESCELQYKAFDIYHQLLRRIGQEVDCSEEKEELCRKISKILSETKEGYLRRCSICGHPLPMNYEYGICKRCYKERQTFDFFESFQ